ncbi:MAG: hypothetical protein AAFO04_04475 [Cyanobacteria bacterium J06592_8]
MIQDANKKPLRATMALNQLFSMFSGDRKSTGRVLKSVLANQQQFWLYPFLPIILAAKVKTISIFTDE